MKPTLKRSLRQAKKDKVAIAHFNISEFVTLKAIWEACQELNELQIAKYKLQSNSSDPSAINNLQSVIPKIPVIIGVSEGEQKFLGTTEVVDMIKHMRKNHDYPIFINADHHKSLESCKAAIDAGFDSVIIDAADKPYAENVAVTRAVVQYARASKNKQVLIEAELGYIGSGSEVRDKLPEGVALTEDQMTKPEEAARFVAETGIDLFAPAVGNIHGMLKNSPDPHLFIKLIGKIRRAAKVPLVLHGGSGTPEEDFVQAIDAGVRIIHISTELRKAWRSGMEKALPANPNEVAPYKLLETSLAEVKTVAMNRLKLFNKIA